MAKQDKRNHSNVEERIDDILVPITVSDFLKKIGDKKSLAKKVLSRLGIKSSSFLLDFDHVLCLLKDLSLKAAVHVCESDGAFVCPPVVAVTGHVDHGKTTLLDTIRGTYVASLESGGITQGIGSYTVVHNDKSVTFLDTPGHESFSSMRVRGTTLSDVVVLVVSAVDGVQNQTVESINHAKVAKLPIIVAITKIDVQKDGVDQIKRQLSSHGVVSEEWGGDNIFVEISAKNNINIKKLLDNILLQSEMLDLKSNISRPARGIVIESKLDKKKGVLATILVKEGTFKIKDIIVSGIARGCVKVLVDGFNRRVSSVLPGSPVVVTGFSQPPTLGDEVIVMNSNEKAKVYVEERILRIKKEKNLMRRDDGPLTLDKLSSAMREKSIRQFKCIIKADTQGSIEAISDYLDAITDDAVKIKIIHSMVGQVNMSDIDLAVASDSILIGFNIPIHSSVEEYGKRFGVSIFSFDVIYKLFDLINAILGKYKKQEEEKKIMGYADVRKIFTSKSGVILGCYIKKGQIKKNLIVQIRRSEEMIFEDMIVSLRRFKEDVDVLSSGYECGISLKSNQKNSSMIHEGDVLVAFNN